MILREKHYRMLRVVRGSTFRRKRIEANRALYESPLDRPTSGFDDLLRELVAEGLLVVTGDDAQLTDEGSKRLDEYNVAYRSRGYGRKRHDY